MIHATLPLDTADLIELTETGILEFSLGDRTFELHTRPRPTASDTAIRLYPEGVEKLRIGGQIEFDRPWGRLTVAMTLEAAR
jgi:hypothetical protein